MQLIRSFIKVAPRNVGKQVERPNYWGRFVITPHRIEFWQGRENQLHDRLVYIRGVNGS